VIKSRDVLTENKNPEGVKLFRIEKTIRLTYFSQLENQMSWYRQIYYQIVFWTKHRVPTIPESHCTELYRYISGVIKNKNCKLYRINDVEDHIHIFSDLHPAMCLSDYVKDIKVASSL